VSQLIEVPVESSTRASRQRGHRSQDYRHADCDVLHGKRAPLAACWPWLCGHRGTSRSANAL